MNKSKSSSYDEKIIIDEDKKLIFNNEDEVIEFFSKDIEKLEGEYLSLREKSDFTDKESAQLEHHLELALERPDEIWVDNQNASHLIHTYIKRIEETQSDFFYVALVYQSQDNPTFIYLHFPTKNSELVETYRRGDLHFDQLMNDVELGCVEGDALSEGDELAVGLYEAMTILRSREDVEQSLFADYSELREETIEEPDEIWRNTDLTGNTLVSFIKDFSMNGEELYYLAVTIEDEASNSHALLFSFPTNDESLVERYRHGENLQAEEVVQESSH